MVGEVAPEAKTARLGKAEVGGQITRRRSQRPASPFVSDLSKTRPILSNDRKLFMSLFALLDCEMGVTAV